MSLPYPLRTGRPHDTRSQGYIVAAMLGRRQCRHDAVRVEKRWRTLNWSFPPRDLSTTNNRRGIKTGAAHHGDVTSWCTRPRRCHIVVVARATAGRKPP